MYDSAAAVTERKLRRRSRLWVLLLFTIRGGADAYDDGERTGVKKNIIILPNYTYIHIYTYMYNTYYYHLTQTRRQDPARALSPLSVHPGPRSTAAAAAGTANVITRVRTHGAVH